MADARSWCRLPKPGTSRSRTPSPAHRRSWQRFVARERSEQLTVQELPDARGDPGGVEAVLGVEAPRVARLAEALDAEAPLRHGHHVAQRLGHRAAEPPVDRMVLDRHDVTGLARGAEEQLLVERLDGRRVDDLRGDPVGLQEFRRPEAVEQRPARAHRSEEHTSELQSRLHLVCRLLLEKKKKKQHMTKYNDSI